MSAETKSHKSQFRFITEVLEQLYFWPKDDNPDNLTALFYLKLVAWSIFLSMPMVMNIWHVYHFRSDFNYSMVKDLSNIFIFAELIILGSIYQISLKEITQAANMFNLRNTGSEQEPFNNLTIDYEKVTKAVKYLYVMLPVGCCIFALWDNKNCEELKLKSGSLETCGLLVPVFLPFDFEFFPLKQLLLIHQAFSLSVECVTFIHTNLLLVHYIDKTVGTINYLLGLVDGLDNSIENGANVDEYLKKIIDIHKVIIGENERFVKFTGSIIMISVGFCRLILATLIFDVVETGNATAMVQVLSYLFFLSLGEYSGQLLINKSFDFAIALDNLNWYKIKASKDRRNFMLLHLMSRQPLALYEGRSIQLSNARLLEILKATYSGTACLIRVVGKPGSS